MTNKPKDYEWVEYLVNAETRKYLEKNYIGRVPPVEIYDLVTTVVEKTIIAMPTTQTYRDTLNTALAGIVDAEVPLETDGAHPRTIGHAKGTNQANATTRAFLQGLLDDIKD